MVVMRNIFSDLPYYRAVGLNFPAVLAEAKEWKECKSEDEDVFHDYAIYKCVEPINPGYSKTIRHLIDKWDELFCFFLIGIKLLPVF